ncbi:MAG: hypothetical protein RLZZ262_426 [Bacteroidota bacterium]|jgi:hypothetical protein
MRILVLIALLYSSICLAQGSPFPKNYVGGFFVTGYYTEYNDDYVYTFENGVDFRTAGLYYARRLTKNFFLQSNAFAAGNGNFYIDGGIKCNAFVIRKLQPSVGLTVGSRLGVDDSSRIYYSLGLDYHVVPHVVVQAVAFSNLGTYTQGLRFGATYKF